jgi:protein-arginine kinase activator protein McsA
MNTPILPCARCKSGDYVYVKENSMGHNTRGVVCEMCEQSTRFSISNSHWSLFAIAAIVIGCFCGCASTDHAYLSTPMGGVTE